MFCAIVIVVLSSVTVIWSSIVMLLWPLIWLRSAARLIARKIYRTAFAGLLLTALFIVVIILVAPRPAAGALDFAIVDVRAEYGHLVAEVEHFNPDGSHWFFEHYVFPGREENKHPRAVDQDGRLLLDDGSVAPWRLNADGRVEQYAPLSRSFKRSQEPFLDTGSILSVIQQIHKQRRETGWSRGKLRLRTGPLDSTIEDRSSAAALASRFQHLIGAAYRTEQSGTLLAMGTVPDTTIPYGSEYGTVSTFHPDSDPETDTVDGYTGSFGLGADTFANHRDDAGQENVDNGAVDIAAIRSTTSSPNYLFFRRITQLYDTSSIDDGAVVTSATMDFVVTSKASQFVGFADSVSMVTTTPASNDDLVNGDYAQVGSTKQASDLTLASLTADSSTFNSFTLNSTGEGNISLTGITKFGIRMTSDTDNNEPTHELDKQESINAASADEVLSGDKRPRLVVTHVTPTAAITGTVGDGATEQEVRDGAGTIIITLTDDTWVASGGTFDAQRQAIINGLDAAESEAAGWNAEVRDEMNVSAVARTSSTVVTITIDADDVDNYGIVSNETITVTAPNAALVSSSLDITATPTIAITVVTESAVLTGTLGGSGGTTAEIVAGAETIIITLTNTAWVASGATFNAQRQAILDGLVADLSDQNGWNSLAFAVGDVVQTSGTVVTITMTAEAAYAIPATETITVTVPAAAIGGTAIVATPTFAITPSFQTSGTRVSVAIDLSSVTDVAYCAIGWESIEPANTTVTIETSVNGGTSYSAATNGSCPTGLTVGGSLATITDFRVRVTLATTDTSVTPLITALGLIVEDTSGQELYYQLNTTPSSTIADRSGNSNTGTMSFPVQPSGISNSSNPLESTEAPLTTQQALPAAEVTSAVSGAATSGNLFNTTEVGFSTLPGQNIVEAIASAGDGLPQRFVWFIFLGMFTIGMGMLVAMLTGDLLIAGVAMAGVMALQMAIGNGLLPGWVLFVYIPMGTAFLLFRRGFPI